MKKKFNFYKREIIIVYCLLILAILIFTIRKQRDFDNKIEAFSLMSAWNPEVRAADSEATQTYVEMASIKSITGAG